MDESVILDVRISRSGKYTIGGLYSYICSVMGWAPWVFPLWLLAALTPWS
jgi:hypothetical protein